MSILLNALNKSESKNDDIDSMIEAPLDEDKVSSNPITPKSTVWIIALLGMIVVLLLVILLVLFNQNHQTNEAIELKGSVVTNSLNSATNTQNTSIKTPEHNILPDSATTANKSSETDPKSVSYLETFKLKKDDSAAQQASLNSESALNNQATGTKSQHKPQASDLNQSLPIKELNELTDIELMMTKEVIYEAHVYSADASQRFIFVGGDLKQENDQIKNAWYLERIEENAIIINNNMLRVRLPKP